MRAPKNTSAVTLIIALVAGPLFLSARALAASTGTVAATVTPMKISVSVTDGSVAYGTLDLSATKDTTSSGLNDTQTATNDGNVAEDLNIESTDATGGTNWTLSATPGADQYEHDFSTDSGTSWTPMTTSYASLSTNVAASGTKDFDLKIHTPTSSSDYTQKSITVTVQATQH
ncbi:MAG TPA: hypothetical protein VFW90_04105 [Candidatus Saccharimonadales bacterium]|nr:hypothetical protein [Candidatus Saccharimonadales bacterium]